MLIVIVIKHFAACGSPCAAAPFLGEGRLYTGCVLGSSIRRVLKKRAKNSFLVTIATNCHETSNLGEVMKSILIHELKTNLAFMYFFHGRFSIHFACGSRCVNYRWSNDDFIIMDSLPEKKAKKFGWRKHFSRWISEPRERTELHCLRYIQNTVWKHFVHFSGSWKLGWAEGVTFRAWTCD